MMCRRSREVLRSHPERATSCQSAKLMNLGTVLTPTFSLTHHSDVGMREKVGRRKESGWGYTCVRRAPILAVSVEAMTTNTAATTIAMSQRTQSIPGLPSPPNSV
jgi:hypothetical protein